jgi:hypothetical protein
VRVDGVRGDPEDLANRGVALAPRHQAEHLALALREHGRRPKRRLEHVAIAQVAELADPLVLAQHPGGEPAHAGAEAEAAVPDPPARAIDRDADPGAEAVAAQLGDEAALPRGERGVGGDLVPVDRLGADLRLAQERVVAEQALGEVARDELLRIAVGVDHGRALVRGADRCEVEVDHPHDLGVTEETAGQRPQAPPAWRSRLRRFRSP